MRLLVLTASAVALLASIGLTTHSAHAREYPFCIAGNSYNGALGECSFDSYAQCQATAAGRRASCLANPYFTELRPPSVTRRLRRHASAAQ